MANNRSHDLILLPSSFQLNCLHQVGNFVTNKSILVLKLIIFQSIGYLYIIIPKIGNARGQYDLQNWGCPGLFLYGKTPLTLDYFWQKLQGAFYLYPFTPPELIASVKIFRPFWIEVFSLCIQTNSLLSECGLGISFHNLMYSKMCIVMFGSS